MTTAARARCALNRVLLAVLSLVGLAGAVAVILSPAIALSNASAELNNLRSAPMVSIESTAAIGAVVCAVVFLIEILAWGGQRVFEAQVDGGSVEYPAGMVAKALAIELEGIDGIQRSRVDVSGSSRKVDVYATLTANADDDSQDLASRAASVIHGKLEGLGLESGRLRLTFKPTADAGPSRDRRVAQVA